MPTRGREEIRKERALLRTEFKEAYAKLATLLFEEDPVGINFGDNTDEYEPEGGRLCMSIRALLFDADEVLQYPAPDRNADLARILGFVPEPVDEFVAEVHAVEDTTLTGMLDFLEVLPPALARWGAAEKARDILQWLNAITVDQSMLDLVSRLRARGYCCALATNQQPHRASFMANELRYRALFDHCFFSCDMGLAKPDSRYFEAVLATLQLEPNDVIFVDDKPQNVKSANSVGIRSICFANTKDGRAPFALGELLAQFGIATEA